MARKQTNEPRRYWEQALKAGGPLDVLHTNREAVFQRTKQLSAEITSSPQILTADWSHTLTSWKQAFASRAVCDWRHDDAVPSELIYKAETYKGIATPSKCSS